MDEVDSLPLLAQVKLLRFLQDKEYRPLGSTKALKGDVRIVAASNADLETAIAAGTLRRDLYYRLIVVPILLPALRHRSDDIILLAHHFLAEKTARLNSPAIEFSPEAEAAQKERRTFWQLIRKHKIDVQKFKVSELH